MAPTPVIILLASVFA